LTALSSGVQFTSLIPVVSASSKNIRSKAELPHSNNIEQQVYIQNKDATHLPPNHQESFNPLVKASILGSLGSLRSLGSLGSASLCSSGGDTAAPRARFTGRGEAGGSAGRRSGDGRGEVGGSTGRGGAAGTRGGGVAGGPCWSWRVFWVELQKPKNESASGVGRVGDRVKIFIGVLLTLAPPIMRWLRLPRSRESPGLLSMSAPWMEIQWDTGLDHSSGLFNICLFSSASIPSS